MIQAYFSRESLKGCIRKCTHYKILKSIQIHQQINFVRKSRRTLDVEFLILDSIFVNLHNNFNIENNNI